MILASAGVGPASRMALARLCDDACDAASSALLVFDGERLAHFALQRPGTAAQALRDGRFALAVSAGSYAAFAPSASRERSGGGLLALVLSGNIGNFRPLKRRLIAAARSTPTSSQAEIIADLVRLYLTRGARLEEALQSALALLTGELAVAVLARLNDECVVAAGARGRTLYAGGAEEEAMIATAPHIVARLGFSRPLQDGDVALLHPGALSLVDQGGMRIERSLSNSAHAPHIDPLRRENAHILLQPIEAGEPIV